MKKIYSLIVLSVFVLSFFAFSFAAVQKQNEIPSSFKVVNYSAEWKVVRMSDEDAKDYFVWISDKNKHKSEVCFLSYDAKKLSDLNDIDLKKSAAVDAKSFTKEKVKSVKVSAKKSKLDKDYFGYCYTVANEKYLKYGENSTELIYQNETRIEYLTSDFNMSIQLQKWNGKEFVVSPTDVFANDANFNRLKFGAIDKNPVGKALNKYKYVFYSTQDFKFDEKKNASYVIEDGNNRYLYLHDICGVSYSRCEISRNTGKYIEVDFYALNVNGTVLIDPLFVASSSEFFTRQPFLQYNQTQVKNATSGLMLLNNSANTFFSVGDIKSGVFDNIIKQLTGTSDYCSGSPNAGCEALFYTEETCNAFSNHQGGCGAWANIGYCSGSSMDDYCYHNFLDESSCNLANPYCYWDGYCQPATECHYQYVQGDCETYSVVCSWQIYSYCPTNTGFTCAGQNTATNITEACDVAVTGCSLSEVNSYNYTKNDSAFTVFLNSSMPANTSLKIATRTAQNYLTHANLVYHWSFNEGLNSRVGNSTTTNYGMKINESGVVGFGLESSDDYATATKPQGLESLTGLSVSLWARTASSDNENLITDAINAYQRKFSVYHLGGYGTFLVSGDGSTFPKVGGHQNSLAKFNDGKWHHFVGTWQGSPARMELWKDGVMIDNTTDGGTAIPSSLYSTSGYDIHIGGFPANGGDLSGDVDEVMIFNKSLNSTEITSLYENMFLNFTDWISYESVTNETNFRKNGTVITEFFQFKSILSTQNTSLSPSIVSYNVIRSNSTGLDAEVSSENISITDFFPTNNALVNTKYLDIRLQTNIAADNCFINLDNSSNVFLSSPTNISFNYSAIIPNGDHVLIMNCSKNNISDQKNIGFYVYSLDNVQGSGSFPVTSEEKELNRAELLGESNWIINQTYIININAFDADGNLTDVSLISANESTAIIEIEKVVRDDIGKYSLYAKILYTNASDANLTIIVEQNEIVLQKVFEIRIVEKDLKTKILSNFEYYFRNISAIITNNYIFFICLFLLVLFIGLLLIGGKTKQKSDSSFDVSR